LLIIISLFNDRTLQIWFYFRPS